MRRSAQAGPDWPARELTLDGQHGEFDVRRHRRGWLVSGHGWIASVGPRGRFRWRREIHGVDGIADFDVRNGRVYLSPRLRSVGYHGDTCPAALLCLGDWSGRVHWTPEILRGEGSIDLYDRVRSLCLDRDEWVRSHARRTLATFARQRSREDFAPLIESPDPYVRAAAVVGLEGLGAREQAERIAMLLDDPEPEVQVVATRALAALGATEARERIARLLSSPRDELRQAAATSLGELGDPAAAPALRSVLAEEEDEFLRSAAALSLGWLGSMEDAPALAACLVAEDADVWKGALEGLGYLGDASRLELILAIEGRAACLTRWYVTLSLSRMGVLDGRADPVPKLDGPMGHVAADHLVWAGAADRADAVAERLADRRPRVRALAARVLARLGGARHLEPLEALLADRSPAVRAAVALAVGRLAWRLELVGEARQAVLPRLASLEADEDEGVQLAAGVARALLDPDPARACTLLARIEGLRRPGDRITWTATLVEALDAVHSPAAWRRFEEVRPLGEDVASTEAVARAFAAVGLHLQCDPGDLVFRGRVAAGRPASPRSLLERCTCRVAADALLLEGDTVRYASAEEARAACLARLRD